MIAAKLLALISLAMIVKVVMMTSRAKWIRAMAQNWLKNPSKYNGWTLIYLILALAFLAVALNDMGFLRLW